MSSLIRRSRARHLDRSGVMTWWYWIIVGIGIPTVGASWSPAAGQDIRVVEFTEHELGQFPALQAQVTEVFHSMGVPAPEVGVQAGWAFETSDGSVVVGDRRSGEVFAYRASGEARWSVDATSLAAADIHSMDWMGHLAGDTIGVWDASSRNLARISLQGVIRSNDSVPSVDTELTREGGSPVRASPIVIGALLDGSLVAYLLRFDPSPPTTRHRTSNPLLRFDMQSQRWTTLGASIGAEMVGVGSGTLMLPAGARGTAAVVGDRIIHGWTDDGVLQVIDETGAPHLHLTLGQQGPKTSPREWVKLMLEVVDRQPPSRQASAMRALQAVSRPDRHPAWQEVTGVSSEIWVKGARGNWFAFSLDGELLSAHELPPNFRPTDQSPSGLLGMLTHPSGEVSVVRLRLPQ